MRTKDTLDVFTSGLAVVGDALAVFAGFMLAVWIRFDSGWIELTKGLPPRGLYLYGSGVATVLCLLVFRSLGMYVRPQMGSFPERIPRLVRGCGWGILLAIALASVIRTEPPFARLVIALSFATVTFLLVLERYLLFRLEIHWARHRKTATQVVVVGTHAVAGRLRDALRKEKQLQWNVSAFLRIGDGEVDPSVPAELVRGGLDDLGKLIDSGGVDRVILADISLPHADMVKMILQCEKGFVEFHMVPDLFRVLTGKVEVQSVDGVPLLGVGQWPLDIFWNRYLKRGEDIVGAVTGLVLSAPVIALAMLFIKRGSPGPLFYRQQRCGEGGREFTLYKLRTMEIDAEEESGPVWTQEDDPRRTPHGAFLRRWNIDELPQFWNVLKGEMSLVGPRPERRHFVEQFREEINLYMWRHTSKPGMTGWAQVNGLRGNTSIQERIKYDLFYLENWSLALDFKVLLKTFFTRKNAY